MKYCTHCGAELHDAAVICVKCGCSTEENKEQKPVDTARLTQTDDTLTTVIKVFLILGCISQGWLIIPLAWCIPMTVSVFRSFRDCRPISTGLKVCTLLFVNLIAGICLLCRNEENESIKGEKK